MGTHCYMAGHRLWTIPGEYLHPSVSFLFFPRVLAFTFISRIGDSLLTFELFTFFFHQTLPTLSRFPLVIFTKRKSHY